MAEFQNKLAEKNRPLIQDPRTGFTGSIFEANEFAAMRGLAGLIAAEGNLSGMYEAPIAPADPDAPVPTDKA